MWLTESPSGAHRRPTPSPCPKPPSSQQQRFAGVPLPSPPSRQGTPQQSPPQNVVSSAVSCRTISNSIASRDREGTFTRGGSRSSMGLGSVKPLRCTVDGRQFQALFFCREGTRCSWDKTGLVFRLQKMRAYFLG